MADKYRNPVMLLLDGTMAQMMEGVEIRDITFLQLISLIGLSLEKGRKEHHIITSIFDTDT